MSDKSRLNPEDYLRRLGQEAKRLPADERNELVAGMQAHVAALEDQQLRHEELTLRLAALGDPRRIVDDYLALTNSVRLYRTRFVIAALGCAWLVGLCSLPYHWFDSLLDLGTRGPMVVLDVLGIIQAIASLALLVTTIVGGMWRRWLDGIATAALLLGAWAMPALVLTASFTGWIPKALLVADVCIVLASTLHWTRRLAHQHESPRAPWFTMGTLLSGLAIVALTVVVTAWNDRRDPTAVNVINDTGRTVSTTYCPRQDCSKSETKTMRDSEKLTFRGSTSGRTPDSVVVERKGTQTRCALVDAFPLSHAPEVVYLSEADTGTCGTDEESLNR